MTCKYRHDCLNCPLKECVHDTNDRQEKVDGILKEKYAEDKDKRRERHARYYEEHREEILARQKKRDAERDRKTYSKNQYLARKSEFQMKRKQSYQKNKEKQLGASKRYYEVHREEILAKRKEKRLHDKNRENKGIDRQSEKLELGCVSTVQN